MIQFSIIDILIPASSLGAMGLAVLSDTPKVKKWSPIIGIIGQPLWIYDTYVAQTWGIFILSVAYLFIWAAGIKKYWFTRSANESLN